MPYDGLQRTLWPTTILVYLFSRELDGAPYNAQYGPSPVHEADHHKKGFTRTTSAPATKGHTAFDLGSILKSKLSSEPRENDYIIYRLTSHMRKWDSMSTIA